MPCLTRPSLHRSGGKKLHGLPHHRRRRISGADRAERRPLAVRRLRSRAAEIPRRRPPSRQVLSDRARQSGAAAAAAADRAACAAGREAARRLAGGAPAGARRGRAGLGRGRRPDRRADGRYRGEAPRPAAGGSTWPGARGKRDRPGDPPLRRPSLGLVRQKRLHPDLCRLQPDRRRRHGRARNADGADRAELARLQELDAACSAWRGSSSRIRRPAR